VEIKKKQLCPGDQVFGFGDDETYKIRPGIIIAVSHISSRSHHFGCEDRLLVLWSFPIARVVSECDCSIIVASSFFDSELSPIFTDE